MALPYTKAPHMGAGAHPAGQDAPHAALLIDFDNVTMGMRSDLSKELKTLLESDIIKGKVSVQRAYADWRRYPQYIVPLSEASVDLIFAPAYGSNKKNATDIRMAIDGMELVFTRPEIGTFILLTGDSDFSSLVLKLKEYGKYVIGVGIQESSSDILVQNCDEYYSYTSLTGLTKASKGGRTGKDPWQLVTDALDRMESRGDVMRSDRLKQVMQELDPAFDEGALGFSKFSKFLAEAASKDLVELRKMENGQYEVSRPGRRRRSGSGERARRDRDERSRGRREARGGEVAAATVPEERDETGEEHDPLQAAYGLLRRALEALRDAGRHVVRDSDVKRKMLALDAAFDETELGFGKFSRFLKQAAEHGVVAASRTERGNYEVRLPDASEPDARGDAEPRRRGRGGGRGRGERSRRREAGGPSAERESRTRGSGETTADAARPEGSTDEAEAAEVSGAAGETDGAPAEAQRGGPVVEEIQPQRLGGLWRFGPRGGATRRRGGAADDPPIFEGQVVRPSASDAREERTDHGFDAAALGLPTEPEAIVRYLTHRYKGVGEKTARTLVERFGSGLFETLHRDPSAVERVVPAGRAEQVLAAWRADYERRASAQARNGGRGGSSCGR